MGRLRPFLYGGLLALLLATPAGATGATVAAGAAGATGATNVTPPAPLAQPAQPVITYAMQLGSFKERVSAVGEEPYFLQHYGDLVSNPPMIIEEAPSGPNATVLRLVAGSFATHADAEAACARLIAAKDQCVVLKRVNGHSPDAGKIAANAGATAAPVAPAAPAAPVAAASPHVSHAPAAPATPRAASASPVKRAPAPPAARPMAPAPPAVALVAPVAPAAPAAAAVIPASFVAPPAQMAERAMAAPVKPVVVAEMPPPPPSAEPLPHRVAVRTPASPRVVSVVAPDTDIALELGKGDLVHVGQPAGTGGIAEPARAVVAVKSPTMIYLYGKSVGETVLYVVGDHNQILLRARVTVSHDLAGLRQALKGVAPEGSVNVATAGNALVLTGNVPTAAMAEDVRNLAGHFVPGKGDVINRLEVTAPDQVNLQVRVAEMSRSTLKNFGINLDSMLHVGNFVFGAASGNPAFSSGSFVTRSAINGANATNNNLGVGLNTANSSADSLLDALSTEGLITVLAEPNLTALSGETASFLAGGEFPIPVPQGNNTTTIEFKNYGVGLSFTPTILGPHRIDLRVRPEVSELSSVGAVQLNGYTIPALTTRRADTTVELASGQSFAIAGLLENNTEDDIARFPGLGDLPVLGALFRSNEFQRNETELVIIVTPYLVRPVSAPRMASPLDGLVPPNDIERIIEGASYHSELARGGATPLGQNGQGLIGPVGFMLE